MISSGYAEEVPHADPPSDSSWYLPHHHVYSPAKPAKVRVVVDCSVRSRGSSLNDRVYQGPKLTTLLNVVLLCIIYSCVISGDVDLAGNLSGGEVNLAYELLNIQQSIDGLMSILSLFIIHVALVHVHIE